MNRFIIIAAFLLPACTYGQTYTTPVRVNLDKSLRMDQSPMMKLDRNGNIFIAWISGADMNGNGPISMAVSTDGGMTFTNQSVCDDANCNSNFQRTAQFVIDTKGYIHLVWMGSRVNNQPDIWYTRSIDQGKTWTKPITIDDAGDSSKFAQDFPSIACDSSDNIYVAFLDSRMVQRKLAPCPQLYFSRSTDGGMTWSVNKRADLPPGGVGGTCECCTESMAVTADGHIYIAYRSNINNLRDIWLERSYDKGITFQPALKIVSADWNLDACPVSGPHIVLDDQEGAHIVWRDQRDDSTRVHLYYAYVPNASTMTPVNTAFDVAGSQLPNYPDIALFDHGKYRVITYETFNYGMRYILTQGTTAIGSANRPIQANGGSAKTYANVRFAADGTRYLCWQDDITDKGDIYFMKETMPLTSANVTNGKSQNVFSIFPNPVSGDSPKLRIERISNSPAILRIIDLLGREVTSIPLSADASQTLTLPKVTPGIYYCILSDGSAPMKIIIE